MLLNQVTQKNAESNWSVNHLHQHLSFNNLAARAEAPAVPEAAPAVPEAAVAAEPSAPPARGHGECGGIKDYLHKQRTLVFAMYLQCICTFFFFVC